MSAPITLREGLTGPIPGSRKVEHDGVPFISVYESPRHAAARRSAAP